MALQAKIQLSSSRKKNNAKLPRNALAIGIDLGGSKISGSLINSKGKVINKFVRPTEAHKHRDDILENLLEVINLLKRPGVVGAGIGIPGICSDSGNISYIPNVSALRGINLKKFVEKRCNIKVTVENDAKCFLLAEARLGAAKGKSNVIAVILGTGVGGGIMIDKKIYSGKQGGAGEFGHVKMILKEGRKIHVREVERLIAGPALLKRYNELSGKSSKRLQDISRSDKNFKRTYSEFIEYASLFFANLINTFNPEMIVVGGGVSNLEICRTAERRARLIAIKELARHCKIRKNKLGADSGSIGAGILAFESHWK